MGLPARQSPQASLEPIQVHWSARQFHRVSHPARRLPERTARVALSTGARRAAPTSAIGSVDWWDALWSAAPAAAPSKRSGLGGRPEWPFPGPIGRTQA